MSHPLYTHFRKCLLQEIPDPAWPVGTRPQSFEPEKHSAPAHALLIEAYRLGGGSVDPFESWWGVLRNDPEYDPSLFFLGVDTDGAIIGVAQCWTGSFLKDLAVAEAWRRKGLGEALLLHAFNSFRVRGASNFDLKVENNNHSGAGRLYRRLGMIGVDQF